MIDSTILHLGLGGGYGCARDQRTRRSYRKGGVFPAIRRWMKGCRGILGDSVKLGGIYGQGADYSSLPPSVVTVDSTSQV